MIDAIALVASTNDAKQAMKQYLKLHRQQRSRELYLAHTKRPSTNSPELSTRDFRIEVGALEYGFDINGIIGIDFLMAGAVLDLKSMTISPT